MCLLNPISMHLFTPLVFFLALLFSGLLSAQSPYRRGTVYLDGATSLSVANSKLVEADNTWGTPSGIQTSQFRLGSSPVGVFALNRLLVGVRSSYSYNWNGESFFDAASTYQSYRVNPFVRYYLLAGEERKWNVFAELGFGTFGDGDLPSFETDFHLAAGLEVPIVPGVVGTARLAYNANADGLNYTTLDIGGNLLLGQLAPLTQAPLSQGTWTTRGRLATSSFGHMSRGGEDWIEYNYQFSPTVGYFVLDGLSITSSSTFSVGKVQNDINPAWNSRIDNYESQMLRTELEARYYPLRGAKLLPFAAVAVGYQYSKFSPENGNPEVQKDKSNLLRAGAGVSYFLGDNVALEVSAAYERNSRRFSMSGGSTTSPVRFREISLASGLVFYFGK